MPSHPVIAIAEEGRPQEILPPELPVEEPSPSKPQPFTPDSWIDLFKHNATHATIPHLNRTLNITEKDDKVYSLLYF